MTRSASSFERDRATVRRPSLSLQQIGRRGRTDGLHAEPGSADNDRGVLVGSKVRDDTTKSLASVAVTAMAMRDVERAYTGGLRDGDRLIGTRLPVDIIDDGLESRVKVAADLLL